jgi:hypothetical protein
MRACAIKRKASLGQCETEGELAEGPHDNGTPPGAQVIYALGAAGTASTSSS